MDGGGAWKFQIRLPPFLFHMEWNVVELLEFVIWADASANTHLDSSHVPSLDGPRAVNSVSNSRYQQQAHWGNIRPTAKFGDVFPFLLGQGSYLKKREGTGSAFNKREEEDEEELCNLMILQCITFSIYSNEISLEFQWGALFILFFYLPVSIAHCNIQSWMLSILCKVSNAKWHLPHFMISCWNNQLWMRQAQRNNSKSRRHTHSPHYAWWKHKGSAEMLSVLAKVQAYSRLLL